MATLATIGRLRFVDISLLARIVRVPTDLPFVMATLVHVQGSAPQKAGARLLVLPDGALHGTIGGGCLEMETRRQALLAMGDGTPHFLSLRLDDDFGWDDGLICGGKATIWLDPDHRRWREIAANVLPLLAGGRSCHVVTSFTPPQSGTIRWDERSCAEQDPQIHEAEGTLMAMEEAWCPKPTVVICGCGHVGAALVPFAATLGFRVVAVDDRPEFASPDRLPAADLVLCEDLEQVAKEYPSDLSTYWVIVTRGHRNDGRVLAGVVGRPRAYVGMIGSRRKVRLIREGLLADGHSPEDVESVHSPVGIDIGALTPAEIALSIAAQLVLVRRGSRARAR